MPNTMHTMDSNSSNVPAFLIKLWKLVEDPTCDDLIVWSDSGYSFIIKDQINFAKDLLPLYFKHNNMASFVRQLNMYGFKKVMNIEKSGLKADNIEMEFQHSCFVKGRSELLEYIKRKMAGSHHKVATAEAPQSKTNAKDILIDLSSIRQKQESMDSMLHKMKSENELLWRELTSMRQKHKAQEQIIQKVIQFLVSIVQRNNANIGVQRKISRMLHNSPSSKGNSSQVSRTIDVLRKKNPECIIVPEQIVSPLGPVIHEVLDTEQEDNQSSASIQNVNVASPCVKSPDSVKESTDDTASKYNLVSLLNRNSASSGAMEPLTIFEAFTPKATDTGEVEESILGLPLDYAPDEVEIENVISIPDSADMSNVDNIISLPEGTSINDIITLSEDGSIINNHNVMAPEVTIQTSMDGKSSSIQKPISAGQSVSDFIGSLSDLQPSTSKDDSFASEYDMMSQSLQTPKVHVIDDDPFMSPSIKIPKQKSKETKKSQQSPNNYQLATTDNSSLAKNVLSNHLLSVDEKLNLTQDRLASNPWNFDIQKLLGLFSTDELVNTDTFANGFSDEINIKSEPCDIIGNELVQFSPNLGDNDLSSTHLFEALSEIPEVMSDDLTYQPMYSDMLTAPDNSDGQYILPNDIEQTVSSVKRSKAPSSGKNKRRKAK